MLLLGFWHTEHPIIRKAGRQFIKYHLINFRFCSGTWKWSLPEKIPTLFLLTPPHSEANLAPLSWLQGKEGWHWACSFYSPLTTPQGLLTTSLMFPVLPWPITCFTCIYSSHKVLKESQLPNGSNVKVRMPNTLPYSSHSLLKYYKKKHYFKVLPQIWIRLLCYVFHVFHFSYGRVFPS